MAELTRTERDFQRALLHLLEDHSFLSLSVEQICQETMMHRSSFDRYFAVLTATLMINMIY
ncbi:hypothetical protein [Limosilactobacillus coleohominis]|uniref:hypothetical protein n=1 Tax=Limosilactobacillus coleohominis TaxID=181675 RepID=UPI0006831C27|nr:hypothetical protein [Limosilactobacillus coleohominis]